ncbi:flagellar biosynthetic protein FliQ [Paucimonas lemoignei]|uniref:flagellar biosynthetic protein FliQ n=1 Tax=Paucimonas lemoignei TaxID=29443 RepID=UPI00104EDC61|nr:flagellar biosynthetic protein FliQ [Paucimonas lemoignei]
MNVDLATQLIAQMLWTAVIVAAPMLGIALIVGLLISIFQVITQVQEMSLTFIPKLAATVAAILILGPWMIKRILGFATTLIMNIPSYF